MQALLVNGVLSNQGGSVIDVAPKDWNMRLRKVYSVFLAAHLYSVSYPFTPISWVTSLHAGRLMDQMFGGTLIIGAAAFHWYIACICFPLPVAWSLGVGKQSLIFVEEGRHAAERNLFTWKPRYYWILASLESLLLAAAWIVPQSFASRVIVITVVGISWLVGLPAAPRASRLWLLERIYAVWNSIISREHFNNVLRR